MHSFGFLSSRTRRNEGWRSFPLDSRQALEILLTAAQSLFAVAFLANLTLSWKEALTLLLFFVVTTIFTALHMWFVVMYAALAIFLTVATFRTSLISWKAIGKAMVFGAGTKNEK